MPPTGPVLKMLMFKTLGTKLTSPWTILGEHWIPGELKNFRVGKFVWSNHLFFQCSNSYHNILTKYLTKLY